jgi:hypothetical protein
LNGEDERVFSWDANQLYIFMREVIKHKKVGNRNNKDARACGT